MYIYIFPFLYIFILTFTYINSYSFSKPQKIVYEDINAAIEELYGTFFRFDLTKEKNTKSNN